MQILHRYLFILLIILFCNFCLSAQNENKTVLVGDLDGNGKADKIVQIKFQKPTVLPSRENPLKSETRNGHYIRYVLYRDDQKSGMIIFEYFIGDDEAVYWQYRIDKIVDINGDGRKDLIFYAGDDTTEETVFLIQKPDHFKAIYTSVSGLDPGFGLSVDDSNNLIRQLTDEETAQIAARWNPQSELLEGIRIKWVVRECRLYESPLSAKRSLTPLLKADLVFVSGGEKKYINGRQKVESHLGPGWIKSECLTNNSPTRKFPADDHLK